MNTDKKMFCFQCEQTAGCSGCMGNSGVCGKKADTAKLQDQLTGALIGLARAYTEMTSQKAGKSEATHGQDTSGSLKATATAAPNSLTKLVLEGLFTTVTNVNFNNETIETLISNVRTEKQKISPLTPDYSMEELWEAQEDVRSLKSLILFGIRGMAAYAYHARVLGYSDETVDAFFFEALNLLWQELPMEALLPAVLKVGEINLSCMALLDRANTESFGTPAPATVPLTVEKGPFIVITGHDLYDLKLLLEQTEGKGISIYTHGEMLPAHAYPLLKKYPHLKGNYGTAWQNQQKEFAQLPAPILFTTNCLMPVKNSYADRVFTTEVVSYPGMVHIGEEKDFTPVIEKALELGGFSEDTVFTGINGGTQVTTGFGHGAVCGRPD